MTLPTKYLQSQHAAEQHHISIFLLQFLMGHIVIRKLL